MPNYPFDPAPSTKLPRLLRTSQGKRQGLALRLRSGQALRLRSGQALRLRSGQALRLRSGQALLSNLYNVAFDSKLLTLASQLERCAGPSSHPFTSPCSSCPLLQNCQSLWDHSVAPGLHHPLFTWTRVRYLQKQFSSFRKLKNALAKSG